MQVGSALVPRSGSGSEPSRLARCSRTPTVSHIITPTATTADTTTHPRRRIIRRRRTIRPRGAAGTLIHTVITPAECRHPLALWSNLSVGRQGVAIDGASILPSGVVLARVAG